MQERLPLYDSSPLDPDRWSGGSSSERSVSARGIVIGAVVGLASGMLLNFLVLLALRAAGLPSSGRPFGDSWFGPVLFATTVIGVMYYGRED